MSCWGRSWRDRVDAKEFNQQYENVLARPLVKCGFQARGQSLFCVKDKAVLALLRLSLKSSGFLRETHFLVCVRHSFLRTLEKVPPKRFLTEPNEYPFKFRVSELSQEMHRGWRHSPCNLGHWKYDTIRFGDLTDATPPLDDIRYRITSYGIAWMDRLTPAEALNQLKRQARRHIVKRFGLRTTRPF
jgi:hypothetical protein